MIVRNRFFCQDPRRRRRKAKQMRPGGGLFCEAAGKDRKSLSEAAFFACQKHKCESLSAVNLSRESRRLHAIILPSHQEGPAPRGFGEVFRF